MAGLLVLDRLSAVEARVDALAERASRAERARDEWAMRAEKEKARADGLAARVDTLERAREDVVLAAGEDDEAVLARIGAATAAVERLASRFHRAARARAAPAGRGGPAAERREDAAGDGANDTGEDDTGEDPTGDDASCGDGAAGIVPGRRG